MSPLTRWSREAFTVPTLRDEMNRLFDDFLTPSFATRDRIAEFAPPLDVAETPNSVTIKVEVPGIKPENVDIQLTGNVLTVTGEKKEERDENVKNWHRIERSYGAFSRSVLLPESIDAEKVSATYDNGVLSIEIAKSEAAKPRQIKVNFAKK